MKNAIMLLVQPGVSEITTENGLKIITTTKLERSKVDIDLNKNFNDFATLDGANMLKMWGLELGYHTVVEDTKDDTPIIDLIVKNLKKSTRPKFVPSNLVWIRSFVYKQDVEKMIEEIHEFCIEFVLTQEISARINGKNIFLNHLLTPVD